ncbi:hypothetical protein WMF38_27385 [Sorangium sp. So ce118]
MAMIVDDITALGALTHRTPAASSRCDGVKLMPYASAARWDIEL